MKAKNVASLVPLQELDKTIYEYDKMIEDAPAVLIEAKEKLENIDAEMKEIKNAITQIELKKKNIDLEIAGVDQKAQKLREQSVTTKKITNDEYQSILKQISGFEADKKVIEDKWLECEMEAEQLRKSMNLKGEDKNEITNRIELLTKEVNKKIEEITKKKQVLEAQRNNLLKDIDREILVIYNRVLQSDSTNGMALARIIQHAKKKKAESLEDYTYTCEGCSVELTMQDVNFVLMASEISQCRNCSRIFYLSEQFQPI